MGLLSGNDAGNYAAYDTAGIVGDRTEGLYVTRAGESKAIKRRPKPPAMKLKPIPSQGGEN
jgi:hypothetical protein